MTTTGRNRNSRKPGHTPGFPESADRRLPPTGGKNSRFLAYLPGVINQLILRKHLLIADPKITLFRNFIRREVGKLGLTPHFIDDTPYHTRWGDVHCATNVFRHPNRYIVRPRYLPTIWAPPAEQTDR